MRSLGVVRYGICLNLLRTLERVHPGIDLRNKLRPETKAPAPRPEDEVAEIPGAHYGLPGGELGGEYLL